jgi:hypothetical protein
VSNSMPASLHRSVHSASRKGVPLGPVALCTTLCNDVYMTTTTPNGTTEGQTVTHTAPTMGVCATRRLPRSTRRPTGPMTPVTVTVRFPTLRGRPENRAAVSNDGVWAYERTEDIGTPWLVTHQPTGTVLPCWYASLPKARRATADGSALAQIPTPEPPVEDKGPDILTPTMQMAPMHAPRSVEARPVARGAQLTMTHVEALVIRAGLDEGGWIARYQRDARGSNYANINTLTAMSKRDFVTLTVSKYRPDGAIITPLGAHRAAEIIASNAA